MKKYFTYSYLRWRFYPYVRRLYYFNCCYVMRVRFAFKTRVYLLIMFLTSPYMLLRWLVCELYVALIGGVLLSDRYRVIYGVNSTTN
jgi:hypothetical protein